MISDGFLQKTGKIRDLCQDVCSSISNLIENKFVTKEDKTLLTDYYKMALESTGKLAKLGYFNKKVESANNVEAKKLIQSILKIEDYANNIVKKIWEKDISAVDSFEQNNFKLCVRALPLNFITLGKDIMDAFNSNESFIQATLISNRNIIASPINFASNEKEHLSFGVVYGVNSSNFVMASEVSNLLFTRSLKEDVDNSRYVQIKDQKVCINGNAVKLKTPQDIILNNIETPLHSNNNVVVLNGGKPEALYCVSYNIKKINLLKRRLSYIANQLNVPLIEIDILEFYKDNKDYFSSSTLSRKIFNSYVDKLCDDLRLYCKFDFKDGAKKLIGLNTNLRYNFLYKFSQNINNFIGENNLDEKETANLIVEKFLKAVEKHNMLTKKREKANGEPLFFPNDTMFISLPTDFLN